MTAVPWFLTIAGTMLVLLVGLVLMLRTTREHPRHPWFVLGAVVLLAATVFGLGSLIPLTGP